MLILISLRQGRNQKFRKGWAPYCKNGAEGGAPPKKSKITRSFLKILGRKGEGGGHVPPFGYVPGLRFYFLYVIKFIF